MMKSIELTVGTEQHDESWSGDQHIVIRLAGSLFAVPLASVQEVERVPVIVPIPHARDWIWGVANLRGTVLTVVDIARLLGLGSWEISSDARILVVRDDEPVAIGVDSLDGMRQLRAFEASSIDGTLPGHVARYVTGIYRHGDELLSVLNIQRLFDESEDNAGTALSRADSSFDALSTSVERGP